MACMFCQCGHMTECHYPHDCETAGCSHYLRDQDFEDRWVEEANPTEEFSVEVLTHDDDPAIPAGYVTVMCNGGGPKIDSDQCEACGCTYFHPCPGGCAWSEYFATRGRMVCTTCEAVMASLDANLGALGIWRLQSIVVLLPE